VACGAALSARERPSIKCMFSMPIPAITLNGSQCVAMRSALDIRAVQELALRLAETTEQIPNRPTRKRHLTSANEYYVSWLMRRNEKKVASELRSPARTARIEPIEESDAAEGNVRFHVRCERESCPLPIVGLFLLMQWFRECAKFTGLVWRESANCQAVSNL
jgi:hypothetical protein